MSTAPPAAAPPRPAVHVSGPSAISLLRQIVARRETIRLLAGAQLASGHRNKLLGNLWSLLDPLASLAVYFLVFGIGFRQAAGSPRTFILHLFVGLVVWRFVADSLGQAASCLRSQRTLLLAADFPRAVIPISVCVARLYDLAAGLLVAAAGAALLGLGPSPALAWLPVLLATCFALTLGAAFAIARAGVHFADTVNLVAVAVRLGGFVSPLFYYPRSEHGNAGIVPPGLLDYYFLNPIAGLLGAFREVVVWQSSPSFADLRWVVGCALFSLVVGFAIFARAEGRYAKLV